MVIFSKLTLITNKQCKVIYCLVILGRIRSDVDKFERYIQRNDVTHSSGYHIKIHSSDRANGILNGKY